MTISALIVDDEPFARERVRRLLAGETDIEVVGECGDGFWAVDAIKQLAPDLLFLDVQMPGKDGFQVLDELTPTETPVVIFLTAYDQYAVRAFEAAALDYLLKPFDEERFTKAVARARIHLAQLTRTTQGSGADGSGAVEDEAQATAGALSGEAKYLERIIIRNGGRIFFRRTDEIDWVEAYGNYVRLHFDKHANLLRETLANLEAQLDPEKFARVHRSALVQTTRIREMRPQLNGAYKIILLSGGHLTMSRRYRRNLTKLVGNPS